MPVSSLDQFGHRFNFFMNGQTSTKTLTGFIFTLLAASLSVASFYIFYNAMVDRTTPTIQVSKTFVQDSGEISIKDDFFIFVLFINYGTLIPRSFMPIFGRLKVKLVYEELTDTPYPRVGNNTDSYMVDTYDMVACNSTQAYITNKGSLTKDMITALDFAGYCVPDLTPEQKEEWTLRSTSGKKFSQRKLAIEFYPCNLPVGCVPWIAKKDLFFYVSTVEKGFNGLDFEKPIIPILQAENRFLMLEGMHKSIDVSLARFTSKTDSGMLYSIIKEESGIRYEGISPYDYSPWGGTVNSPLITVNLVASLKQVSYFRTYGKLTVLVSNIGGIMQVTVSIIAVIYSIYNQYVRKRDLVVYGIMNMLPPEKDQTKSTNTSPGKSLNKSQEEINKEAQKEALSSTKTLGADPRSNMGSFWKYICFGGRQSKKGSSTSLKNLEDFRYFEYWNDCERLLEYTTEVTSMLPLMNELEILRSVFFTNYHERLAPRVGIQFSHEDSQEREFYQKVSSEEVAKIFRNQAATHEHQVNNSKVGSDSGEFPDDVVNRDDPHQPYSAIVPQSDEIGNVNSSPILKELKHQLTVQVLKRYEDYREREKANFQIFSGIKEFLESAAFMNLQGLIQPEGSVGLSKSQIPHMKLGSMKSKYGSGIQLQVDEEDEKASVEPQSNAASMKLIHQNSELMGFQVGFAPTTFKKTDTQKGILWDRNESIRSLAGNGVSQKVLEVQPKSTPMKKKGAFPSNKLMAKTPQVVHNQKNGTNPNSQLVRVKLGSGTSSTFGQVPDSLNALKPITAGTSSTQQLMGGSTLYNNQRSMEQD